jgi:hypothetical protein
MKTTEILYRDNLCLCGDSNHAIPDYKSEALPLNAACFFFDTNFVSSLSYCFYRMIQGT